MLMEEFENWKFEQARVPNLFIRVSERRDYDNFSKFYQDHIANSDEDPLCELAYEIYNLQVCVEGLIDDLAN